jgi:hypothetical protein
MDLDTDTKSGADFGLLTYAEMLLKLRKAFEEAFLNVKKALNTLNDAEAAAQADKEKAANAYNAKMKFNQAFLLFRDAEKAYFSLKDYLSPEREKERNKEIEEVRKEYPNFFADK